MLNARRRSTIGSTVDFPAINVLGFLCYFFSNALLLYSPTVREQYAARNPVSLEPTVRFNDVAFAAHAVLLSVLTWSMFWESLWGFKQQHGQRISRGVVGIGSGCIAVILWMTALVLLAENNPAVHSRWEWIDVVYAMGFAKLIITIFKYMPQVYVNYKRRSTVGWSIWQILFDLIGGVLSIMQLVIDSSLQNDWSGLTGNPVKLGLGNVSIFFDIVFVIQHYCIYRHSNDSSEHAERGERRGLLASHTESSYSTDSLTG